MNEVKRNILQEVAEGRLSPEEAAERLEQLRDTDPQPDPEPAERPTRSVRVIGAFRTVTIVGDPDVREAVAEGAHTARREGDTFVIEGEPSHPNEEGFTFRSGKRPRVVLGLGSRPAPLAIRVNPDTALAVELDAGTLAVRDVRGPLRLQVSAGSARIEGFRSPIDVSVAAGKVQASGILDHGESKVRCEAGAVKIHLERGSDVHLTTRVGLGKVVVPDDAVQTDRGIFIGAGKRETTVGEGRARLDIDASLGAVEVTADA